VPARSGSAEVVGRPLPPRALVGGGVLLVLAGLAALGPSLAPYDPTVPSGPPFAPPGPVHLLGTNDIGQDILSEWLWGARASLLVTGPVALLSAALAWGVGITAGLWRPAEAPLMGLADLLLALPSVPLYLLVVALTGASQAHVVLVLGLLSWPAFARIVRAEVLGLRTAPYVDAARALGATRLRVALVHVLPGTLALAPAKLVLTVRFAVFAEATLAFLGLGNPAAKSWGTMLGWAFQDPLLFARPTWPWWVLPPAASIVALVLGTTWLAVGAAETADPRRLLAGAAEPEPAPPGAADRASGLPVLAPHVLLPGRHGVAGA
jgi:peptide/nickel transport system permease protein